MAVQILSRRSSVLHDRPFPIRLGSAELAVNNNPGDRGLFFADSTASPSTGIVKIGPISVGVPFKYSPESIKPSSNSEVYSFSGLLTIPNFISSSNVGDLLNN